MLWINVWESDNICHPSLCHKDNRIIRHGLHCFHTMTKIWACSFEKGESSMYYWRSRSQWLNSPLPFISASTELTCILTALWTELSPATQLLPTFACCLCCRGISAEYIRGLEELVITSFRNIFLVQSIIFLHCLYINLLMKTRKHKIKTAVNEVIWG